MEKHLIICPNCRAEYAPGEVYHPKHFVGIPKNVVKTEKGKIITILDNNGLEEMNLTESYVCDYCGKKFKASADVSFSTSLIDDEEYTTKFNRTEKLTMEESSLFDDNN